MKWLFMRAKRNLNKNCRQSTGLIRSNQHNAKLNKISRKLYEVLELHFGEVDSDDDEYSENEIDLYKDLQDLVEEIKR